MQILSYVDEPIKISIRIKKDKKTGVKTVEYVIHGPNKVPEWHPLYDEKYQSWGTYERKLSLEDGTRVTVIVYRFYHPERKKTYSILPFFISPYQRHINKVIEDCIIMYIRDGQSLESIARIPSPTERTIIRWIRKFIEGLDDLLNKFESFLSTRIPTHRVATQPLNTVREKVDYLLGKASEIIGSHYIGTYGVISYIFQIIATQNPEL